MNRRPSKEKKPAITRPIITGPTLTLPLNLNRRITNFADLAALFPAFPADYPDAAANIKLNSILGQLDAKSSTLATQGTLASILAKLDVQLSTVATQTTLALILAQLDNKTSTLATQATLALVLAQLDSKTSVLATEATLGAVHGHVDSIDGKVTACNTGAIAGSLTQSTKHDAATYKTAIFYAAADGDIVPLVAGKKIKVHFLDIQAQGTVTVTIRDNNAGGARLDEWKLTDREGAVKPFVPYPTSHYVTSQVAGNALYCDVSAAVTVKINVIYTDADAA